MTVKFSLKCEGQNLEVEADLHFFGFGIWRIKSQTRHIILYMENFFRTACMYVANKKIYKSLSNQLTNLKDDKSELPP